MLPEKNIMIIGSDKFNNYSLFENKVKQTLALDSQLGFNNIVSSTGDGVDKMAEYFAHQNKLEFKKNYPEQYKVYYYYKANQEMVNISKSLIGFLNHNNKCSLHAVLLALMCNRFDYIKIFILDEDYQNIVSEIYMPLPNIEYDIVKNFILEFIFNIKPITD